MANELKAKLVIESEAQGSQEIIKLRGEVDKLGSSAELAGPEFEALAQEVAKLGQQQAAIGQFERLKQSVGELAKRTQELQGATREAALALKEKQAALAAATRAEQTANEQLGQASAQHQALSATIKALGAELGAMAKAAKATGDSSAEMAGRLADGKAQLQVLRAEAGASAQNIKLLAAAQKESAAAMQNAGREVSAAQKQFDALRQSTKQNQTSLDAQNISLQRARDELGKLGISSANLGKSQGELARGLEGSRAALERMAREAEEAAAIYRACDAAFIAPRFSLGRMVLATCLGQTVLLLVLALGASHATPQAVCNRCRLIDLYQTSILGSDAFKPGGTRQPSGPVQTVLRPTFALSANPAVRVHVALLHLRAPAPPPCGRRFPDHW